MFYAKIYYENKKGAGCMRGFLGGEDEFQRFVENLRRPAIIKNASGEEIGSVYQLQSNQDASRPNRKWGWHYDREAAEYSA